MPSLGNDLATIRKEQNLSLDDIQEATKIPKHVISSIEDDSIFSDFGENTTYIRSYVRSYAKALSIDEQQIIYALDKQEKDDYSGSLQKTAEGKKRTFEFDEDNGNEETESHEQEDGKDDEDIVHDHSPEFSKVETTDDSSQSSAIPQPTARSPEVDSVDWADLGRQFQPLASTKSKIWSSIVVFILIVAGGLFSYMYYFNSSSDSGSTNQNDPSTQQASQPTPVSDSLQLNVVPSVDDDSGAMAVNSDTTSLQNQTMEALPDTLTLVIYAAYGKLEPVRVYTDIMDSTNPYWIEQGEAVRYDFVNNIRIRGQFSRMALLMNGHVVQNFREQFYNPDTRRIEINRSFFQEDTKWLQPAPDSLGIDAPNPSVIRERPTFN